MSRINVQQPSCAPMPSATCNRAKEASAASFELALGTLPTTADANESVPADAAELSPDVSTGQSVAAPQCFDSPPTTRLDAPVEFPSSSVPNAAPTNPNVATTTGADVVVTGESQQPNDMLNASDIDSPFGLPSALNARDASANAEILPSTNSAPTASTANGGLRPLAAASHETLHPAPQPLAAVSAANTDLAPTLRPSADGMDLLYPQTLMAIGRLSYQADSTVQPETIADIQTLRQPRSNTPLGHALSAELSAARANAVSMTSQKPASSHALSMLRLQSEAITANEQSMPVANKSRSLVAALPWAPKLFRIACDAEGTATVWIRDYALDRQSMESLVQSIQRVTGEASIFVKRIVVNGHTAWSTLPGES